MSEITIESKFLIKDFISILRNFGYILAPELY